MLWDLNWKGRRAVLEGYTRARQAAEITGGGAHRRQDRRQDRAAAGIRNYTEDENWERGLKITGKGRAAAQLVSSAAGGPAIFNGPKATNYRVGVVAVFFLPPFFPPFLGAFVVPVSWAKEMATVEVRNARPSISVINLFISGSPLEFDDYLVSGAIITALTLTVP